MLLRVTATPRLRDSATGRGQSKHLGRHLAVAQSFVFFLFFAILPNAGLFVLNNRLFVRFVLRALLVDQLCLHICAICANALHFCTLSLIVTFNFISLGIYLLYIYLFRIIFSEKGI